MAVYFLNMKTFGRANGSSAASAVAYRAGERIRDERTGRTYDHSDRQDVMHKEIVLPSKFSDHEMAWARDRASLWNAAENAETRKNARVAREYLVALPVELSPQQRSILVRGFSQELSDRYGFAVDFAIHAPRDFPGSDPRNYHAHVLATTREVTIDGLGAKTTLDMRDGDRRKLGLEPVINELLHVRARWATLTNEALQQAHIAARIDHRTLEAQGIDREPQPSIPRAAFEMERHGYRSLVADRMRDEYQARVQARLAKAADREVASAAEVPVTEVPAREVPVTEPPAAVSPPLNGHVAKPQSLEEIRREARENWLRLRQAQVRSTPDVELDRHHDDDLAR
ncbi:MAG TPA: MobQ family relaxase [Steroidobacteraceae bacterium]|nr:MobQ family relaxase [Steroidobacteraceae bacterium]